MIQVALDMHHLVIRPVAIYDESLVPRYFARQAGPVELVAETHLCRPFEDEEDGIGGLDIKREFERRQHAWSTVKHYLVAELFSGAHVVVNVLCAAGFLGDEIYEHDSHRPRSLERLSVLDDLEKAAQP